MGGPVWAGGGGLGRTLNSQEQPRAGGSREGAEAAQVPAVTLCRTGHPAPRFDVISGRTDLGLPPYSPCTPLTPPARAKFGNGKSRRPRQEQHGPCKAMAGGRARGGHAHACAHGDRGQQPCTPGTRKLFRCGCSPGEPPVHPWEVPTAAASSWAQLRVWGVMGEQGCCKV